MLKQCLLDHPMGVLFDPHSEGLVMIIEKCKSKRSSLASHSNIKSARCSFLPTSSGNSLIFKLFCLCKFQESSYIHVKHVPQSAKFSSPTLLPWRGPLLFKPSVLFGRQSCWLEPSSPPLFPAMD